MNFIKMRLIITYNSIHLIIIIIIIVMVIIILNRDLMILNYLIFINIIHLAFH